MKTILTILFAAMTFAATAQTDSLKRSQDSLHKVQDSIRIADLKKNNLHIQPIVVNMEGDTAFYLHWRAFDVDRSDTTKGMNTYVQLLSRTGKQVATFNCPIPASVVNQWSFDPKPIDDFILLKNPRLKRKL